MYKYILEEYYDVKVSKMIVVSFHPNLAEFFELEIEDYSAEIKSILRATNTLYNMI
jgi:hypothetical protein